MGSGFSIRSTNRVLFSSSLKPTSNVNFSFVVLIQPPFRPASGNSKMMNPDNLLSANSPLKPDQLFRPLFKLATAAPPAVSNERWNQEKIFRKREARKIRVPRI